MEPSQLQAILATSEIHTYLLGIKVYKNRPDLTMREFWKEHGMSDWENQRIGKLFQLLEKLQLAEDKDTWDWIMTAAAWTKLW